ncbi:MAG TPA: flagellar basal body rod protein FlgC [Candidatus Binatia bacterium]|nr:flagellar basal body rod protein FlgC [Candidatus Binatia bacterium]
MNLFGVLDISGSALVAERQRAEVVASNLANADTTRTAAGGPYRRQHVVFAAAAPFAEELGMQMASFADFSLRGVRVQQVVEDTAPPLRRFDPSHPDADAEGYVSSPAVNPIEEMVNLMGASRAYEINVSAIQATKNMIVSALEIGS